MSEQNKSENGIRESTMSDADVRAKEIIAFMTSKENNFGKANVHQKKQKKTKKRN